MLNEKLIQQLIFWGIWLIIPLIMEIYVGVFSAGIIFFKYIFKKKVEPDYWPFVTILIPVYNSQATLEGCINSVLNQDYPLNKIDIFLIDNGSKDNSYKIFEKFQKENQNVKIWWYKTHQGKSKALNKGIFGSRGRYVINIDSDGCLDKSAVKNIVTKFENDQNISCLTGVILIDKKYIEATKNKFLKIVQYCELFEYFESFLVGRNFSSTFNSMYTMAGAFSCFRREVLLKTQLYNNETIGEDTHMTFQIRNYIGGKILLCEDAFFYVDPIESLNKLYIQRQRWQRGEIEVAALFKNLHTGSIKSYFGKFAMRILVADHTLAFPRLIWFFAMIYLYFINYPLKLLVGANVLIYGAYVLNSYIYLFAAGLYLKEQPVMKKFIFGRWFTCFFLPLYRFVLYWIRLAGIVNSITSKSKWDVKNFSAEIASIKAFTSKINNIVTNKIGLIKKIRNVINNE